MDVLKTFAGMNPKMRGRMLEDLRGLPAQDHLISR
jgi:hypothetical protein